MGFSARPTVITRRGNEAGAQHISFHVPDSRLHMTLIQGTGEKTPLPKMSDGVPLFAEAPDIFMWTACKVRESESGCRETHTRWTWFGMPISQDRIESKYLR